MRNICRIGCGRLTALQNKHAVDAEIVYLKDMPQAESSSRPSDSIQAAVRFVSASYRRDTVVK